MPSQQLDLIPARNATTARAECSPALFARLSSDAKTDDVVRELAADPVIRADAIAARSALERRQRPCGAEGIAILIMPLVGVYGLADRNEEQWASFWKTYIDALGDLPFDALDQAVKSYAREGEFFPKPAQLYKLAEPVAIKIRVAAWRAKRIAEYKAPVVKRVSEEDRAKVRAMLDEFKVKPLPPSATKETPQQMAERLRKLAEPAGG